MKRIGSTICVSLFLAVATAAEMPGWALGPFNRPSGANPLIRPNTNSTFTCPVSGKIVHWEGLHTFNPAAVVKDGKVCVIYRAEDDSGNGAIGSHTSRLGLAVSDDGLHFRTEPVPALYPADDNQRTNEWTGGCEDPRLVEAEDGTFVILYTQWNHRIPRLAVATSKDLRHWTKYGPVFPNATHSTKSGAIVTKLSGGRLKAAKIHGKYWMYWGEGVIACASSEDLIHWTTEKRVLAPRAGRFDSALAEAGPPAVVTDQGIVVLYNGKNGSPGDASLAPGAYSAGEALFDGNDPTRLLARAEQPFFKPEMPYERTGQYAAGTTFIEGLVFFHDRWFLYYGCADSFVGVAVSDTK
ncbi:MAG TPA: glycoside hydrolase family 130 protein [Verrucomicrobiae bacterium]|nr:glycoside hydrolase family 130 protein [Verrucomicrobiae bacterium]